MNKKKTPTFKFPFLVYLVFTLLTLKLSIVCKDKLTLKGISNNIKTLELFWTYCCYGVATVFLNLSRSKTTLHGRSLPSC